MIDTLIENLLVLEPSFRWVCNRLKYRDYMMEWTGATQSMYKSHMLCLQGRRGCWRCIMMRRGVVAWMWRGWKSIHFGNWNISWGERARNDFKGGCWGGFSLDDLRHQHHACWMNQKQKGNFGSALHRTILYDLWNNKMDYTRFCVLSRIPYSLVRKSNQIWLTPSYSCPPTSPISSAQRDNTVYTQQTVPQSTTVAFIYTFAFVHRYPFLDNIHCA